MRNLPDRRLLALRSFAAWVGAPDFLASVPRASELPREYQTRDVDRILSRLAASLYYPPQQDLQSASPVFETNWADSLYRQLAKRLGLEPSAYWPDGKSAALIISHDVDRVRTTYQHLAIGYRRTGLSGLLQALLGRGKEPDPFRNFAELRATEKRWGVRSTIFVLKERRRYAKLLQGEVQHSLGVYDPSEIADELRACRDQGCEIGIHLSFDSYYDRQAFADESRYIAEQAGTALRGARSHYLNFDARTVEILLDNGFDYDSSMGFNFIPGFRCGTAFPFILGEKSGKTLWEVPLQLMDTAHFWQSSYHGRSWSEVVAQAGRITSAALSAGGVLCINMHQRFFNRAAQGPWIELIENIIESCRERNVWTPTLDELTAWWNKRARDGKGAVAARQST